RRFVPSARDEIGIGTVEEGEQGRGIVARDRQIEGPLFLLRVGERFVEIDAHRRRGGSAGSGVELPGEEKDAVAELFRGEPPPLVPPEKAVRRIGFAELSRRRN